jgi:energy-converting hydrogenase Eha subunit C
MNNRAALDWFNFLLANVKDGLGPFLAAYLATQHWEAGRIGIVMMIAGLATVLARAPIGAFVDCTYCKRGLIVVACATVAIGALAMSLFRPLCRLRLLKPRWASLTRSVPLPSPPYHSASWAQTPSPSESVGM